MDLQFFLYRNKCKLLIETEFEYWKLLIGPSCERPLWCPMWNLVLTERFKFGWWTKMTDSPYHHQNFRCSLVMETWPTPPRPSLKILNFRFDLVMERWLSPPPSTKILNLRFGLVMERWPTPSPTITENFKFQIWPGHGKMTDPPPPPDNDHIFFRGLLHERPFTREGNSLVSNAWSKLFVIQSNTKIHGLVLQFSVSRFIIKEGLVGLLTEDSTLLSPADHHQ